jgi:hypothetical protein
VTRSGWKSARPTLAEAPLPTAAATGVVIPRDQLTSSISPRCRASALSPVMPSILRKHSSVAAHAGAFHTTPIRVAATTR